MHAVLDWFAPGVVLHWFVPGAVADWFAPSVVLDWVTPGVVLLAALAVGVGVHELLHLVALSFTDADCTVTVLPSADAPAGDGSRSGEATPPTARGTLRDALTGGLVRVEVTHLPPDTPEWVVRTAALLPVLLVLPLALVAAGVLPNPVAVGDRVGTVALVAVTACGLPSPADWAVVWYGSDLAEN